LTVFEAGDPPMLKHHRQHECRDHDQQHHCCVIARSNEAKALGFKMGDPYFKVKPEIARHRVAVFSSNYTLYGDMSRRVVQTLEQLALSVEVYSIDEAFLQLAGLENHALVNFAAIVPLSWGFAMSNQVFGFSRRFGSFGAESVTLQSALL
jgi:nucleotidyltransferase/DNA polymerase involved in DNA repair